MIIIESTMAVFGVIFLVWAGIFIGREFGSFEKFVIWYLKYLKGQVTHLPPPEDE